MKIPIRLSPIFILTIFALSGCYYDKENELYPYTGCGDTTNVTYSQSIAPIMVANCNICHSAGNPSGGVVTSNYDGLSIVAQNGHLWADVNWEGDPMPKGGDKLSVCDLAKIKKWVDAGSPNN